MTYLHKFDVQLTASGTRIKYIGSSITITEYTDTSKCTSICHGAILVIEQFGRYMSSTSDGGYDPLATEEWIRGLECIFEHTACTNVQKVQCAKFMFVGAANHWWNLPYVLGSKNSSLIWLGHSLRMRQWQITFHRLWEIKESKFL